MLDFLVLNYNRPKETELCLLSIRQYARFAHQIILLNNGGDDEDVIFSFYKRHLIDKLILRKSNSGCGLGTRELFNDFNLKNDYVCYVQCDQFMGRVFEEAELKKYIEILNQDHIGHIDLAGNQGNGKYSERAHITKKSFYNKVQYGVGGPGNLADMVWTEECMQNIYKALNLTFFSAPKLFIDNGKNSIREYPCGGIIMQETDTKALHIVRPVAQRTDFPNIKINDAEWEKILSGEWVNGTIPEGHKNDSFLVWERPYEVQYER